MTDSIHRRKTLGALDQNFVSSGLPQPSSVLKKSGSQSGNGSQGTSLRASGFGAHAARNSIAVGRDQRTPFSRAQSGDNLQDLARGSASRLSSVDLRRSSTYGSSSRQSSFGLGGQISSTKDPRPIRDKHFQAQCVRKIVNYLTQARFPQPVTHKSLTSPTQKDFFSIFKWLYLQLDPNYQFVKKMDDEIMSCMKALQYPFIDSLSRSQLMAIGSPHSLPAMLAMLNWLVEVVNATDQTINEPVTLEDDEVYADNLFFDYLSKAYHVFLAGDDDFSEMEKELEQEFDKRNEQIMAGIDKLKGEVAELKSSLEKFERSDQSLDRLNQELQVLSSDKEKFQQYIEHLEKKKTKLKDLNARLVRENESKDIEAKNLQNELSKYNFQLKAQSVLPEEIDKMTADREYLNRNREIVQNSIKKATREFHESEAVLQDASERLTDMVDHFNSLAYRIDLIPETARWANGDDFELKLEGLNSERSSLIPNKDLRNEIRPKLSRIRSQIGKAMHQKQDESIQLRELLDKVQEGLNDRREELDTLDAKISSATEQYNEMKETLAAEIGAANAEIEKLERDLYQMKLAAQNGHLQLEQRAQSVSIEYDQLLHACTNVRENLYSETWKILEDVIQFKIHIQKGLEALENEAATMSTDASESQAEAVN